VAICKTSFARLRWNRCILKIDNKPHRIPFFQTNNRYA